MKKIQFGLPTKEIHCVATITPNLEYVLIISVVTSGVFKALAVREVASAKEEFVIATVKLKLIGVLCFVHRFYKKNMFSAFLRS